MSAQLGSGALLAFAAMRSAGENPDPAADELDEVIIVGAQTSLAEAQDIKRNRIEIVDSVVAYDVAKLPDFSVTDALQRITGIQIARDRGEGSSAAIRGLTQMETTLNGREFFTAGTGRTLDFADLPTELLAGIDVYKTSSADHIEGGIGGTIDLRTRRPFDFEGRQVVGSARFIYSDLADHTEAQFSALASQRWTTDGAGSFGALLNIAYQERAWREDQKSTGSPSARADIVPGEIVTVASSTSETTSVGRRRRVAGTAVLQWSPSQHLDFHLEGSYTEFHTLQDSHQINVLASNASVAGSATLFPGTSDVQRITWIDAPISVLSFARDTEDRTRQVAAGGTWTGDTVTLKADASYTTSFNHLFFSGPFLAGTAATFTHDLSTRLPGSSIGGTDLLAPASFRYTGVAYRTRPFDGDLTAVRIDGIYNLSGGFFRALLAGVRHAERSATNEPGLIFADATVTDTSAADRPEFVMPNPYGNFFPGESAPSIRNFIVGDLTMARDATALRSAFGITEPIPVAASPIGIWHVEETTQSAYFAAEFAGTTVPLDGNIGLRAVATRSLTASAQTVPDTGTVAGIEARNTDTDYLPSLNLRYALGEGLYLRAAASRTTTRPNFDQLSPSLLLLPNPVSPSLNQGSAGNPGLRPVRADNVDLAVEKYFSDTTSLYFTVFLKKVDGFVTTVSSREVHDGVAYQVSRPKNSAAADVKGVEAGYQQFFEFLPGAWSGFGMQANYTYIDSETPNSDLGTDVPLQNLSGRSYNLIAMYERQRVTVRVAYNWRDRFLSGITNIVGVGALPIYTDDYGWLDAGINCRLSERISLTFDGLNLLNTSRKSYYGLPTRPQSNWVNDLQLSAAITARF